MEDGLGYLIGWSSHYLANIVMCATIPSKSGSIYFPFPLDKVLLLDIGHFANTSQLFASASYETKLLFCEI